MNVLFLLDHLGYPGGAWHGRTAYLINVLPHLVAAGHNVELCVLRDEHPAAERLRRARIEVTFFNARRHSLQSLLGVGKRMREKRIDILHVAQRESSTVARALKLFAPHSAVVMHIVDAVPLPLGERWLNRLLPQPDVALCVSGAVRATATHEYGVTEQRVRVLHNAIDLAAATKSKLNARDQLRAEWRIPRDALVVVSTSRFHLEKRLDSLIQMLPQILVECPSTVLVFAGHGEELERCRALTRHLGVEHAVRFLGQRNDIPDVLAASDVKVMLCREEAFGFSAIEAFAMGVPVVAWEAGGLAEVILHGRTGLLADTKDDNAFRRSLIRVLQDPALRHRLGAGAREDVRRFGVDAHVTALTRIYEQCLRARHETQNVSEPAHTPLP